MNENDFHLGFQAWVEWWHYLQQVFYKRYYDHEYENWWYDISKSLYYNIVYWIGIRIINPFVFAYPFLIIRVSLITVSVWQQDILTVTMNRKEHFRLIGNGIVKVGRGLGLYLTEASATMIGILEGLSDISVKAEFPFHFNCTLFHSLCSLFLLNNHEKANVLTYRAWIPGRTTS